MPQIQKSCARCKQVLPAALFSTDKRMKLGLASYCRPCARAWHKERPDYVRAKNAAWKAKNPEYPRVWVLQKKYGLTMAAFKALLLQQEDKCLGCLRSFGAGLTPYVDHCHKTNRVRGLLCNDCNVSIGRLCDDPKRLRRLADYLELREAEEY